MVPGPFSSQTVNAQYMEEQGAATTIANDDLTPELLRTRALALLLDHPKRAKMAEAAGTPSIPKPGRGGSHPLLP